MKLYKKTGLTLLTFILAACGEGEGDGSSDKPLTESIGVHSLSTPLALSTLPTSPVALVTAIPSDYGYGSLHIDINDISGESTITTKGSATGLQLQPLSHLKSPSVGSGVTLADDIWQNGWNGKGVEVAVIDDFATQMTSRSPGILTATVSMTRDKKDTSGTSKATYNQVFLFKPRPYLYRNTLGVNLMTHGDIVAGIAAGDESTSVTVTDPINAHQLMAFNANDSKLLSCSLTSSTLACDYPMYTHGAGVASTATYRLAPGIARGASLSNHTVPLGPTNDSPAQWAAISGALTNVKTAKVINLSLGALITNNDLSVDEMIDTLETSPYTSTPDAVFTVAAGNDSGACNKSELKQTFNGCNTVAVALAYQAPTKNATLVVGALDSDGKAIAKYSNRAGLLAQRYLLAPGDSGYVDAGNVPIVGTSFAAPKVAGAAAILRGMYPSLSASDIANVLLLTANKDINGDGTPEFSGVNLVYGHGKLDLLRAINYLKGNLKLP